MNIEAVTTVATTDTSHHQCSMRKHHILRTTPQVALGVALLANGCDKDRIWRSLSSYSCWKKCNMSIPFWRHGIRIHFERDE